jgi:hypothetical protein
VRRVNQLAEVGATFFAARFTRAMLLPPHGHAHAQVRGSGHAPPPAWAAAVTAGPGVPPPRYPRGLRVLVGINAGGVHVRPLPPAHAHGPATAYTYGHVRGRGEGDAGGSGGGGGGGAVRYLNPRPSAAERWAALDGSPPGWHTYPLPSIGAWSVRRPSTGGADDDGDDGGAPPAFLFGATEGGGGGGGLEVEVALASPQADEMACTLHAWVFRALAAREGRRAAPSRASGGDYGALASATRRALEEAEEAALGRQHGGGGLGGGHQVFGFGDLPQPGGAGSGREGEWTVITDAATGEVAWWNRATRQTVFSRPPEA